MGETTPNLILGVLVNIREEDKREGPIIPNETVNEGKGVWGHISAKNKKVKERKL